jgi:HEAT repeat protein
MHRLRLAAAFLPVLFAAQTAAQESRPSWRIDVRVVDDGGKPVEGVAVKARLPFATAYSDLARRDFAARSDAAGVAAFTDLPPGMAVVFEAAVEPWVPTRSPVAMPHADGEAPAATVPDLVLTSGRALQVTVTDAFGTPVEDGEVRILPLIEARLARGGAAGPDRTADLDGTGRAKFDKLPAELLTVEVTAAGFETRMTAVDLRRAPLIETTVRMGRDPVPPGATMPWLPSPKDAFAIADAGNLPVMVALTMDGERANDGLAARHFKDREVIRVAELIPCLVSSVFGEGGVHAQDVAHGEVDFACTRYGSIPCASHQAVEAWVRKEFLNDETPPVVPRHMFVATDGRVLADREYYLSERDLRRMILRAIRDSGSDVAVWPSVHRLQPIWRVLIGHEDSPERREAVATIARLVESGDDYAAMALRGSGLEMIAGDARLQILDAILVPVLDDPVRVLEGFLYDAEPAIRIRAWQRLAAVSQCVDCDAATSALAYEDDDSVFAAALKALRVEERGDALAVTDAGEGGRWRIVEILLGRSDAASIRGLDTVLDQIGTEGRNRLLRSLAQGFEDESAVRRLFAHGSAPEASAVAALRALGLVDSGSSEQQARIVDLFLSQAKSQDALVRQEAVTQLGAWRTPPAAMPALEAALTDESAPVRLAAAIGLWRHGIRKGGAVLAEGIDDPELGPAARGFLQAAYSDAAPADADGWRKWVEGQ